MDRCACWRVSNRAAVATRPRACLPPFTSLTQVIRAALSGGGGACFLERLGVRVGAGCTRLHSGGSQLKGTAMPGGGGGGGGGLAGLLESPVARHKDAAPHLRRLLEAGWP